MIGKFESYTTTFLYAVNTEDALTVRAAEASNPHLSTDFYNSMIRHDGIADAPHWCEHASTFEVSVYVENLARPDYLQTVATIIDTYINECANVSGRAIVGLSDD